MKTKLTVVALVMSLLFLMPLNVASAGTLKDKDGDGLSIPVGGTFTDALGGVGKFSGTLNISRFAAVDNKLHAIGTISGTLTDSQGNVVATGIQAVSLPVTATGGVATAAPTSQPASSGRAVTFAKASYETSDQTRNQPAAVAGPAPLAVQTSCQILNLSIGAIDLNLLGLTVHLNPVLLIVSAVPGAGALLGNLLCAITNLLNGVGSLIQLAQLLNQLLALLGSL